MIRWMAEHKVAANLLMLILLVWGGMSTLNLKQELFPEFELDLIRVSISYPGATPEEVEESIIVPIESAIEGIEGIKELTSTAREGAASLRIELDEGSNRKLIQDDVQEVIDRISIFPDEAESPVITAPKIRREVLNVVVYGDAPNRSLVEWAELIKGDLLKDDAITQVDVEQRRGFELKIEIPRSALQQYSLTMDQISQIIQQSTLDMPGGKIETSGGDLLVRTKERRYSASEYARIPLLKNGQGTLLLGDVARISDGFEESVLRNRYNGLPSQRIAVYRVGEQTPTEVSLAVKKQLLEIQERLPESISTAILNDRSTILQDRIDLLVKNLLYGLVLVFLTLSLFLKIPLAFWIMMGIPISYAGAMIAMPGIDVSINMMSLFAFILVLGIVVDDAIVVGENIYAHQEMNKSPVMAAVDGAKEIGMPVLITILTTTAAFIPFYFVPGTTGKFFRSIPNVLIVILFLSLVEAMFILPGHLAHRYRLIEWFLRPLDLILNWPRSHLSRMLKWLAEVPYRKTLNLSIRYRYTTLAIGLFMMLLCAGLALGGHIRFTFFPRIDSDRINVRAELPFGTPVEVTEKVEAQMLKHAQTLLAKYEEEKGKPVAEGIYSSLGRGGSHTLNMRVYLKPLDERGFESKEFSRQWQRMLGQIPGLTNLSYRSRHRVASENDIDLQLSHPESKVLERVVGRFKEDLSQYPGVSDIEDTTDVGKKEVRLTLSDAGHAMGMNAQDLTRQVRGAFQGLEVFKIQRDGNEISVMLRIPEEERRYLDNLEDLVVLGPQNQRLALSQVATLDYGLSYSSIKRVDRRRVINVTANVDSTQSNTAEVERSLKKDLLPVTQEEFPQLRISFEGSNRAQQNTMKGVQQGSYISIMLIFSLLALQFRSYLQPLIVMSAIPFGIVGAVMGHYLLGFTLSIVSVLGMVALSGIVVNDSLIMVDFINRFREQGHRLREAVLEAGVRRFRPIVLTTLTTFFGLMPMMFETSRQARFLIPMAISLAFGVLFATFITLVLVPVFYYLLNDFLVLFGQKKRDVLDKTATAD